MISSRFFCFIILLMVLIRCVNGESRVPCFFIFGDSLADNGNNNHLRTKAKVDYRPYGIDFPNGHTGRFTNGKTSVDFLAEFMGFKNYISPYTTANSNQIIYGVNYASGSAGILYETGSNMGAHVSFNRQLKHHRRVISRLNKRFGNVTNSNRLRTCLYYVGMGSNDYLNNYYRPKYFNSSKEYTVDQYAVVLIGRYSRQLKVLYKYGARMVAVNGLSIIGCVPYAKKMTNNTGRSLCLDEMNHAAGIFNVLLESLVYDLNRNLTGAMFVFINNAGPMLSELFIGFARHESCCKVNNAGFCISGKKVCPRRNYYVFWDAFHPTEVIHGLAAANAFSVIQYNLLGNSNRTSNYTHN